MEWVSGQPRLPSGTLICVRQASGTRTWRILDVLGTGQCVVHEGVEIEAGSAEVGVEVGDAEVGEVVVREPEVEAVEDGSALVEDDARLLTPSKRPLSVDRTPSGRFAKKSRPSPSPSPSKASKASKRSAPRGSLMAAATSSSAGPSTESLPWHSLKAAASSSAGPSGGSKSSLRQSSLRAPISSRGVTPRSAGTTDSGAKSDTNVAIKLQYTPAATYRKEAAKGKAMGQLGYEWDVMTDIQEKVGHGVITEGLCCGWAEIKLPDDELWTVGLFAVLVMPIYQEFDSQQMSPELFLGAIQALRQFHSAGYVHGDIKPANFLMDGDKVLVSDVESAMKIGTPLAADYAATPFYQALPYLAHRLECSSTSNRAKLVKPVSTTLTDEGMDFWAIGIMLLQEYYPEYLEEHFPFDALMAELQYKQVQVLEEKVLEKLRVAYSKLYDEYAYEDFASAESESDADVPPSIKALLRFCIQRPSNCGLLGRNEPPPTELATILEKMGLDIDETDETTTHSGDLTLKPKGLQIQHAAKILPDKSQHPVRLPHGHCQIIWDESSDQFAIKVPGIMREAKRTYYFTQCPADHAVGYGKIRPRYTCGSCEFGTYGWEPMRKHIQTCDKGAKSEKLVAEMG